MNSSRKAKPIVIWENLLEGKNQVLSIQLTTVNKLLFNPLTEKFNRSKYFTGTFNIFVLAYVYYHKYLWNNIEYNKQILS